MKFNTLPSALTKDAGGYLEHSLVILVELASMLSVTKLILAPFVASKVYNKINKV